MYLKYITQDFLQNLKNYGLSCWILLSFLYLFLLGLQLATGNSYRWITQLGLQQTADVFFKPTASIDEIQMWVQKIELDKIPVKLEIENLSELINLNSSNSHPLSLSDLNIELLPKVSLAGYFQQHSAFDRFLNVLKNNPLIDEIINAESHNQMLIELLGLIQTLAKGFVFISLLLSAIISYIILKLINQKRQAEIQILKSVGSSNLFIIWPQLLFLGFTQTLAFFSAYGFLIFLTYLFKISASHIGWLAPMLNLLQPLSLSSLFINWVISFALIILMSYLASYYSIRTFLISSTRFLIFILITPLLFTSFSSLANDSQLHKIENEMSLIKSQNKIIVKKFEQLSLQKKKSQNHLFHIARFMHKLDSRLKYQIHDQAQWVTVRNQIKAQSHLSWLMSKNLSDLQIQSVELDKLNSQLGRRKLKLKQLESQLADNALSTGSVSQNLVFNPEEFYAEIKKNIGNDELSRLIKMNHNKETKAVTPAAGVIVFHQFHPRIGHTLILEIKPNLHFIVSGLSNALHLKDPAELAANTELGQFNPKKKTIELRFKNQTINLAWLDSKGRQYEKP